MRYAEYDPRRVASVVMDLVRYDQEAQKRPKNPTEISINLGERIRLWQLFAKQAVHGGYPYGDCFRTTRRLRELGYSNILGWFKLDHPYGAPNYPFTLINHGWGQDKEGRIIELNGAQFNPGLLTPIRPGVIIVEPGSALYTKYLKAGQIDYQEHFYSKMAIAA